MRTFLLKYWFLIGLSLSVVGGIAAHEPLRGLGQIVWLRDGIVFVVLYLMMIPLKAETILKVVRRPVPALLASFVNLGLIPPMAWIVAGLLPPTLARGLIVAAATPCTVASAAVWTRKAGGNDAVAVMVTVLTNLGCFAVTPAWVWLLTGDSSTEISLTSLITKLSLLVLLPMVLAQLSRRNSFLAEVATRRKTLLSNVAQIGMLAMVFIGSIRTGEYLSGSGAEDSWPDLLLTIGLVSALHLVAFIVGWWMAAIARIQRPEQIAVGFSASQKTLLVGLSVAIETNSSILPMVAFHFCQLFIGTFVADRIAAKGAGEATRSQGQPQ